MNLPGVLGRHPAFAYFFFARAVSQLGGAVTKFALILYMQQAVGTGISVGTVLLALALPQVLDPFAGTLANRVDQRHLMIFCDLGQALLVGAIALFLPPLPVLVPLIGAATVLSAIFQPAGRSAVPALVSREDLTSANALLGTSLNASIVLGPALAGFLVAGVGARGAFALDAATFAISAALLLRLRPLPSSVSEEGSPQSEGRGFLAETRAGLAYISRHRVARAVTVGLFLSVAFAALDDVALVFLTREILEASAIEYGLTASACGIGMIAAPLLLLRRSCRGSSAPVLLIGLALTGTGTVLTGLSPVIPFAIAVQALAGSGNGFENVAMDTLIGRTVPRHMLGRVFGVAYGSIFFAQALAYASGGLLLSIVSARAVFIIAGCGVLLALVLVWRLLPGGGADVQKQTG